MARKLGLKSRPFAALALGALVAGCAQLPMPGPIHAPPRPPLVCLPPPGEPCVDPASAGPVPQARLGTPIAAAAPLALADGQPIDLPTALRLADARNPDILVIRERLREAFALQRQAELVWLPDLNVRSTWMRHDGQIQRATGQIITVSRSSLFVGGGATLSLDLNNAYFTPLAARQVTAARAARAAAETNEQLLDVALAYTDLMEAYASLRINQETLTNAHTLLKITESHERTGTGAAADTARARTEVQRRERQRYEIQGRINVASARLARLLLLPPQGVLVPAEPAVVPVALVPEHVELAALLTRALQARPELAENQALIAAAIERWRMAKLAPLLPSLQLDYAAGGFGGGINSHFGDFSGRSDFTAGVLWELQNLGLGNQAKTAQRQSQYNQAVFRQGAIESEVARQVVSAFSEAFARKRELTAAAPEIAAERESYRLKEERIRRAPEQGRPIELLQAVQALAQAQFDYLGVIADYNRAQFRLYTALGNPPLCAFAPPVAAGPAPAESPEPLPPPRVVEPAPRR
jgi:outer membrane protein TolC